MRIYGFKDNSAVFVIERDGQFTHDGWPCKEGHAEVMIREWMLVEITREEAERRIEALEESGKPLAYWPLPKE